MRSKCLDLSSPVECESHFCDFEDAQLVIYFGDREIIKDPDWSQHLQRTFPEAIIVGASSGGHFSSCTIQDRKLSVAALNFSSTHLRAARAKISCASDSRAIARQLAEELNAPDLSYVLVFSDGIHSNGSALANGFAEVLPSSVPISGGLVGDGELFEQTLIGLNGVAQPNEMVAIGFYGKNFRAQTGCAGGWLEFGPKRKITRAHESTLFELDNEPALNVYKKYLGDEFKNLPASALLFPLQISASNDDKFVRTVLGVNHDDGSLSFAGDVPEGAYAQLMHASFGGLSEGARSAALQASDSVDDQDDSSFSLLVSCIGRRLLMGQNTDDELIAARSVLGRSNNMFGFYSYGELCPPTREEYPLLFNQVMAVTKLTEAMGG